MKHGNNLEFIGTFEDWTVSKDRSGYYWYQKQEPKKDEPKKDEISIEEPKADEPKKDEPNNNEPKTEEPNKEELQKNKSKTDEPKTKNSESKKSTEVEITKSPPKQEDSISKDTVDYFFDNGLNIDIGI